MELGSPPGQGKRRRPPQARAAQDATTPPQLNARAEREITFFYSHVEIGASAELRRWRRRRGDKICPERATRRFRFDLAVVGRAGGLVEPVCACLGRDGGVAHNARTMSSRVLGELAILLPHSARLA